MTESRRSLADPVPPPHGPTTYDQHQLATVLRACVGCLRAFHVPERLRDDAYVCAECAK